jgi:hypothetical protein
MNRTNAGFWQVFTVNILDVKNRAPDFKTYFGTLAIREPHLQINSKINIEQ